MKTYTWTGSKGNKIELRAECKTSVSDKSVDLDGNVTVVGKELTSTATLEVFVDGNKISSCYDINFWETIDIGNGLKRIWGIEQIAFTSDRAIEIDAFLKSVIAAGKSEEVVEIESANSASDIADAKSSASEIIKLSETTRKNSDGTLMTNAQAKSYLRTYNNVNNEGGEGFTPFIVTAEMLTAAQKTLSK